MRIYQILNTLVSVHKLSLTNKCFISYDVVDLNDINTDSIVEESSSEDSCSEIEFDQETLIRYYFQHGFSYEEILLPLKKHHKHEMSYLMHLRRLKAYGLRRRRFFTKDDSKSSIQTVRQGVSEIINGPG